MSLSYHNHHYFSQSDKRKILEVYKHCKNFKKTQLGAPYGRVLVVR